MPEFHCPICNRVVPEVYQEEHHSLPKCKKRNGVTITLCNSCADMLHQFFSISELKNKYNTVELIKADEKIKTWIEWISKKPNFFQVTMAKKKRR